jgi:hypothetical protein
VHEICGGMGAAAVAVSGDGQLRLCLQQQNCEAAGGMCTSHLICAMPGRCTPAEGGANRISIAAPNEVVYAALLGASRAEEAAGGAAG